MADQSTFTETLNTPVTGEYDVIVAGGGASGLIAAVSAARAGARTLLVERSGCLGGTGTQSMVAQWIGFYNGEVRVVGGLPLELTRRVKDAGGSDGFGTYVFAEASAAAMVLHHFSFNPEVVKFVADEFALEAGVDVMLHTSIVRPMMTDGAVGGVVLENIGGRFGVAAKMVVDATGDAVLAKAAGVPCEGEDLGGNRQPCTLVFRMSNVDVKRFRAMPREEKRALALEGLREGRLFWESLSFCSTPGGTDAICLMSRLSEVDALNPDALSAAEMRGRQQVKGIVSFLRERVPGFEDSVLAGIAARLGVRETRRIVGERTLTGGDIVNGERFEDSIALGAGPVDLHEAGGTGVKLWMPDTPFEIPMRTMLPKDVAGLVITGRAISADREGNGGARHMATAMALGEAAGAYAALAFKHAERRAGHEEVRAVLRSRNAFIDVEDALEAHASQKQPQAASA